MLMLVPVLLALQAAPPSALAVRYVANAGVMLTIDGQKVLIDAPIREGIAPYATSAADERQRLEHATSPYDDVSAILVTHWHEDHFSAEAVAEHLRHNSRAVLVSSREVVERVRTAAADLPAARFVGVTPPPGESQMVAVGSLKVHVLRVKHNPTRRWPEEHVAFIVQGSRSVIHTGDAALEPGAFVTNAALPAIDVAIVPFWHLTNDDTRTRTIEGTMKARAALGMHVPQADGPKIQAQFDAKQIRARLLVTPATDVPASAPGGQPAPALPGAGALLSGGAVSSLGPWRFYSAFWPNLHHVLYGSAWARRVAADPKARVRSGAFPSPLAFDGLSAGERRAWDEAVSYYDRELADRDLLFDQRLTSIRHWLAAAPGNALPDGLTDEVRRLLEAAAPVYRAHWWQDHDRANRAWIAATVDRTTQVLTPVSARLAALYQTPWLRDPARVDVVFVGNRQGAYTSDQVVPHVTISSSDPQHVEWTSVELVFHETSHVLIDRLSAAINGELERQHKGARDMWHVALFWITGQVMRETLAARGVTYEPYLYSTALLDRAWPQYKKAIEGVLPTYVAGKIPLDAMAKQLAAAF